MSYTLAELKEKTVAQLREIAAGIQHEAVQGHSQMNKEHLLGALCKALDIDMHAHHEVVGIDKTKAKARIKAMKDRLAKAIEAKDPKQIKFCHRQIHRQKRNIHKASKIK